MEHFDETESERMVQPRRLGGTVMYRLVVVRVYDIVSLNGVAHEGHNYLLSGNFMVVGDGSN